MIRIGMVGAGFMGSTHADCYGLIADARVVGVADLRTELARKIAAERLCPVFASLGEMLESLGHDVDAVDVCLPTHLHAESAVAALDAGKHVIVEKPLALTVEDGRRVVEAARRSGKQCMVAHVIRFWPEYLVLQSAMDSKELGAFRNGAFRRVTQRRKPGTSWEEWLYDPARCGSPAMDLHIHDLDLARLLLGEPLSHSARGSFHEGRLEHLFAQYTFPNDAVVSIESAWDYPLNFPFEMGYSCVFEGGALEFRSSVPNVRLFRRNGETQEIEPPRPQIPDSATAGNISSILGYYNEIEYFVRCLETGKPIRQAEVEDSLASLKLMLEVAARV